MHPKSFRSMRRRLSLVFLLLAMVNTVIALLWGNAFGPVIIGGAVSVGFGIIVAFSLANRAVDTMQDGHVEFREKPLRYMGVLAIQIGGYLGGLALPWVVSAA